MKDKNEDSAAGSTGRRAEESTTTGSRPAQPGSEKNVKDGAGDKAFGGDGKSEGSGDSRRTGSGPAQEIERRPGYRPFLEPDGPLKPHHFMARAELLRKPPRVLITAEAYKRMYVYIQMAPREVGWLGTVTRLASGDFLIDQVFLLEQEVTSVETELSTDGQNKLVMELIEKGDEGLELVNRLRFWGHSHVRMGTAPSGTDERTMERFASEGMPWALRGIFNKSGRAEFTVYLYEEKLRICDAPWALFDPVKGVVVSPVRPAEPPASAQKAPEGESGGLFSVLFGSDWEPYAPPKMVLRDELKPSDELRRELRAEFEAKVKEKRAPWFCRDDDEEEEEEDSSSEDRPLLDRKAAHTDNKLQADAPKRKRASDLPPPKTAPGQLPSADADRNTPPGAEAPRPTTGPSAPPDGRGTPFTNSPAPSKPWWRFW